MSKFKVGDKVKVTRAIITNDESYVGKIFEVKTVHELGVDINGFGFCDNQLQLVDKPKPTIINLSNTKIVINKPYVIVTDGKHTGKAKCNPEDVWSVEKGLELAVERYKEEAQPKTIEERFPIGSIVKMIRKSGEPWTCYDIGTLAKVTGHTSDNVYCDFERYHQAINPDDLDLVVTRTVPNIELTTKLL